MVVGCEFAYEAAIPTVAIFQVQPDESMTVTRLSQTWMSEPNMSLRSYVTYMATRAPGSCYQWVIPPFGTRLRSRCQMPTRI